MVSKMLKGKLPANFDGLKFAKENSLGESDFYASDGYLYYPKSIGKQKLADYVAPPEPDYVIERRQAYEAEGCTMDELVAALWEMAVEGRPERAQELQGKREAIKERLPRK